MNDRLQGINVFLIGMMGAGKTSVGQQLAKKLNYQFLDTDALVEKITRKTINEIFADDGEAVFRQLEAQVLSDLSAYTRLSVATGGGIVIRRLNWSYLHHGLIVWLDASVEVLLEHLQNDTARPLLQNTNPATALQNLLNQRRSLYAQADLHISISTGETPEQIADMIIAKIPTVLKSPPVDSQ